MRLMGATMHVNLAALGCAAVLLLGGTAVGKGHPRPAVKARPPVKADSPKAPADQGAAQAEQHGPAGGGAAVDPEAERGLKRGERVEFDGRLIEGQTAA